MNQQRFVICTQNTDADDLELRKVYLSIPDENAEQKGFLRVIDESGEDYLYPTGFFVAVELPQEAQEALLLAA